MRSRRGTGFPAMFKSDGARPGLDAGCIPHTSSSTAPTCDNVSLRHFEEGICGGSETGEGSRPGESCCDAPMLGMRTGPNDNVNRIVFVDWTLDALSRAIHCSTPEGHSGRASGS
jgi:hypothetical protein